MWDHAYRQLEKGELIRETDEVQFDTKPVSWGPPGPTVGKRAPDPLYTSHRIYRRLKGT